MSQHTHTHANALTHMDVYHTNTHTLARSHTKPVQIVSQGALMPENTVYTIHCIVYLIQTLQCKLRQCSATLALPTRFFQQSVFWSRFFSRKCNLPTMSARSAEKPVIKLERIWCAFGQNQMWKFDKQFSPSHRYRFSCKNRSIGRFQLDLACGLLDLWCPNYLWYCSIDVAFSQKCSKWWIFIRNCVWFTKIKLKWITIFNDACKILFQFKKFLLKKIINYAYDCSSMENSLWMLAI